MSYSVGDSVAVATPGQGRAADVELVEVQALREAPDDGQVITIEGIEITVDGDGFGKHPLEPIVVLPLDWKLKEQLGDQRKISVAPSSGDDNPLDFRHEWDRPRPDRGPKR